MKQTRLESVLEITANYTSGFLIAYLVYEYVVLPYPALLHSAFWVTGLFTVVSVIRSYIWRRFFDAQLHKFVHYLIKGLFSGTTEKTGPR